MNSGTNTSGSAAKPKGHELPYFDEIFERQDAGDSSYSEAFARNVHFGFWPTPANADLSLKGYAAATEDLTSQILRFAEIAPGQSVIDIGCGLGGTIAKMDAEFSRMHLTGLNIDPRQIEAARKLCSASETGNRIDFIVADAASTQSGDCSYDRALAIEVIFHFPSRLNFFREMHRILKPGATLVISEVVFNPIRLPLVLWKAIQNLPQLIRYKASIGDLGDPVTIKNYYKMAATTGFEIAAVEDWSENVRPSFECLKNLNARGTRGKQSLYDPRLLDFAAYLMQRNAQKYLALKLVRL